MSAPGDRPPLRRDAIVEAARRLISEVGLDGLTLRRLADVFDVSAPALYAHFTDKNELLRAVAEREFDDLIRRYEQIDEELGRGDPLERIRAQCRFYVKRSRDDPELFRVMFLFPPQQLVGIGTVPAGIELPAATRALDMGIEAVRDAIDLGVIDAEDALLPAMALWAGVHGLANILLLGLELAPDFEDALIDEVTNRTLQGYGVRSGTTSD
jgi:AcrR family transcriptional regulator